jgi:hypothetical protein
MISLLFRHSHWLKITDEYNRARGTKYTSQNLSKKLANMKQRDRQKFMADNKKTLVMKKLGEVVDDDDKSNPKVSFVLVKKTEEVNP